MNCHREACVKVKWSPGAVWCLFSSHWIPSHLIVSTQSSQNWITVEFYLSVSMITIITLERRTTPLPRVRVFISVLQHICILTVLCLRANMAESQKTSVLFSFEWGFFLKQFCISNSKTFFLYIYFYVNFMKKEVFISLWLEPLWTALS